MPSGSVLMLARWVPRNHSSFIYVPVLKYVRHYQVSIYRRTALSLEAGEECRGAS